MAMYDVFVTHEYAGYKAVEANSEEEAIEKVWRMMENESFDPLDEFDCETQVHDAELLSAKVIYLNERK